MSLAERPPDSPCQKLPILDIGNLAYSSYFRHFAAVLRTSWLWLILSGFLIATTSWLEQAWMAPIDVKTTSARPVPVPLTGLADAIIVIAGISIAVEWHRLMILNQQPSFSGSNVATGPFWRYVLVSLVLSAIVLLPPLGVVFMALRLLAASMGHFNAFFWWIVLVVFGSGGLGIALALRLSPLLAAQAIGRTELTFEEVWCRTRGNTWRLFLGIVLTALPPLMVPDVVFFSITGFVRPSDILLSVAGTITILYYLLVLPISIGFLSHAYRHFFKGPAGPGERLEGQRLAA